MKEDLQAIELQKIYRQANAKCRKKILAAAVELLKAQNSLGNKPDDAKSPNKKINCGTTVKGEAK